MNYISQRKNLETKMRQSQKMEAIGTLAAGIAHEINTPLQFVGNNIRFLTDSFNDVNKLTEQFLTITKEYKDGDISSDRLSKLSTTLDELDLEFLNEEITGALNESMDGVKSVSKIVSAMKAFAHPGTVEKTFTNINKVIENTIIVSKNEWKLYSEIKTDFDPKLPLVPCYIGEFNQVILNIIVNASHAIKEVVENKTEMEKQDETDRQGTITITTRHIDELVEISISDTGKGIPDSVRERVFEPFFTTKDVGKGTGQGLSLAHSVIVENHGGEITFESEVGVGTTFMIKLPSI